MTFKRVASSLMAVSAFLSAGVAAADEHMIIKYPGDHPAYRFEAEPHGLIGFTGPFGYAGAFGAGFRGTVIVADNGFIKTINNSVGIGFGADFFFRYNTVFVPVVMQWNFYLSTHWSVFGEPGLGFVGNGYTGKGKDVLYPVFGAGGRFHFSDKVALTMRIGYPSLSVGVSFLL